jgi:hypothetical protein
MSGEERERVVAMLPCEDPVDALLARAKKAEKRAAAEAERAAELQQQLVEGLRRGIESLCSALEIELSPDRRSYLNALNATELDALLTKVGAERRWP